jgi:hypothetical protein
MSKDGIQYCIYTQCQWIAICSTPLHKFHRNIIITIINIKKSILFWVLNEKKFSALNTAMFHVPKNSRVIDTWSHMEEWLCLRLIFLCGYHKNVLGHTKMIKIWEKLGKNKRLGSVCRTSDPRQEAHMKTPVYFNNPYPIHNCWFFYLLRSLTWNSKYPYIADNLFQLFTL